MPEKPSTETLEMDWFYPAILSEGSVDQCLDRVQKQLEARLALTSALKSTLHTPGRGKDTISSLKTEVRNLQQTIKVRVELLPVDRAGPWFRVPVINSAGPFASELISAPVFQPYAAIKVAQVKAVLKGRWEGYSEMPLPFDRPGQSLWQLLLNHKRKLEELSVLRFKEIQIDLRGDGIDQVPDLESFLLRAFIKNVCKELDAVETLLNESFDSLWSVCTKFWNWQSSQESSTRSGASGYHANDFQRKGRLLNTLESKALHTLGFTSMPTKIELKKRYRELAHLYHPDKPGGSGDRFSELNEAHARIQQKMSPSR